MPLCIRCVLACLATHFVHLGSGASNIGGTALVLSGGGAKGAFEAGLLTGICENQKKWRNSWNMVLGASIGALNAGILAQFPEAEQCSHGVPALNDFWHSVRSQDDVFVSSVPGLLTTRSCLSDWTTFVGAPVDAFVEHGGLCDPSSGTTNFNNAVKKERIHDSGMQLRVVASSMKDGRPKWFTERDEDVVDGCMASGSIAPLVYPKEVPQGSGNWYVDGGIFANVPIVKALDEGATHVLVILLERLNATDNNGEIDFSVAKQKGQAGLAVLQYYMNVISNRIFLDNEIRSACTKYPNASIMAYMPPKYLGDLKDFSGGNIDQLIALGLETAKAEPFDLCEFAEAKRFQINGAAASVGETPGITQDLMDRVFCWLCGCCMTWALCLSAAGGRISSLLESILHLVSNMQNKQFRTSNSSNSSISDLSSEQEVSLV